MQSSICELSIRPCLQVASRLLYDEPFSQRVLPSEFKTKLVRYDRILRSKGMILESPRAIKTIEGTLDDSYT